ncbi:hypothetical protein EDC94DRAFT_611392 [Helicostylum pulchrum]|uniref:Swiss Army Knife 2H phosphoesterase domain-containing protein n=1 Tax=Helicostylum pulchrum TaxID=562976 RepID=A0ABP9Y6T0_9FUNG|nr:hypothetical protein EDC94DRAFT_611392 [Helicostylum pulchrum]
MDPDLIFEPKARYLSLHGSYIDRLAEQANELVTSEYIENREKRDKGGHHVTVINHLEMASLMPTPPNSTNKAAKKHLQTSLRHVNKFIIKKFGEPTTWKKPIDLGLGTSREDEAISYFRVLFWPFGQDMRNYLGLGRSNFHITVGFKPRDVHLYKGPATLICLKEGQTCTTTQMDLLVKYAYFYHRDCKFIQKLYQTCWRHGYYNKAIRLTRILIECKNYQV